MRWHRILAVSALALTGAARGEEPFLLDFGPEDSAVAEGFTRVTETAEYDDATGYGWDLKDAKKRRLHLNARNENFATQSNFLKLGPLFSDHVVGGQNYRGYAKGTYTFRVKTAPGTYVGAVIMGKMTEKTATTINRPPNWFRDYGVRVNGTEILRVAHAGLRDVMASFHKASEENVMPGDSLFGKLLLPHFHVTRFQAEGTEIRLELDTICPVNALLIYPASQKTELESKLAVLLQQEREFVDSQYTEIRPDEGDLQPEIQAKAKASGLVLFTRPEEEITPYARPKPDEAGRPVGEFVPPGEKGILRFCVLPLRDLSNVSIALSDLVNEDGRSRIKSDRASAWISHINAFPCVRTGNCYKLLPRYAFPYEPQDLKRDCTRLLSVYVKVPPGTPPGDYTGHATISSPDASKAAMQKLVVKVLPFELNPSDITFGMYAYSASGTRLRFADMQAKGEYPELRGLTAEIERKLMLEMKEAGMNTVAAGPKPFLSVGDDGEIAVDQQNLDYWEDYMAIYKDVFGDQPMPAYGIGWGGLVSARTSRGFWGREVDKWRKEGFTDEAIAAMEKLMTRFYQMARERQWPEIIFYVQDEMANHGLNGGRMAKARAELFRKVADKLGVRTCSSMNGPVEIPVLPYLDIAIPNGALPVTVENLAKIREAGAELWFYNIGSKRFPFGYYLNKTHPKGRLQWAFCGAHHYLSQIPSLPSVGSIVYSMQWNSKLEPSRRWDVEQMRQGILDYRYFRTLETLVAGARASRRPDVRAAVARADELMTMILDGVKIRNEHSGEDFVSGVWSSQTCQRLRWRLAMAIMEVTDALE